MESYEDRVNSKFICTRIASILLEPFVSTPRFDIGIIVNYADVHSLNSRFHVTEVKLCVLL